MLNDIVLSGLINLFALLGSRNKVDDSGAERLLDNYLGRYLGLRNIQPYMDLYGELLTFYSDGDFIDKESVVRQICEKIKDKLEAGERKMVLLRLMEFCMISPESFDSQSPIFLQMSESFGVDDSLYADFCDFVYDRDGTNVRRHEFTGYSGHVKTLWIPSDNKMVFSYLGEDDVLFDDVLLTPGIFQIWHVSGVLKNHKGAPVYFSEVRQAYESETSEHIIYSIRDVNFRFPDSNNGLHNLSMTLSGGELVAIMGGSGAGKTTLLSILNGSLKPQSGTLEINGHSIDEPEVRALIGFVPQDDLLIEELTVYQNLYYTARLCFDGMGDEELERRVLSLLRDLGLDKAKDLVVGSPLNKTISGGQRKRLNIALELIREPSVIFLDEPTSGLSSSDTDNVMGLLKEQTCHGKLVVLNIHQPSSDVYKLFDRLCLLDLGGYPVFDGNPIDAVTYFKDAANYADADTSTCPTCGNVNPETVLNIINEKALDDTGHLSGERKVSPEQWHEMYLERRVVADAPADAPDIPASNQKKPSAFSQMGIFLERNVKAKLTNLQYILITLLEAPLLAVICGLLTRFAPPEGYTVMDNKNMVSYFFMAIIVAIFIGMSGSAEEIIKDRVLLKREKFLDLSYSAYIWSKIIFAAAVSLIQTALFIIVGNIIMGLHGMFLMWWMILFISALLSSLIGLLLSQCLNSVVAIYITIPILLIPQILLCGLVVSFSDLNGNSKTDNVPVIGDVIPSRWAFEALAVGTFRYNDYERPYFDMDKERFQAMFYRETFIYELESHLETIKDDAAKGNETSPVHLAVLKNELPTLASACGLEPYRGDFDYESVSGYLNNAKDVLGEVCNRVTLQKDNFLSMDIKERGKDEMLRLKRANCNIKLEEFVTGGDTDRTLLIVDGHIVPQIGRIYLTPKSNNGRAPFYSSVKVIAGRQIPTLWFNMSVLFLMCVLFTVLLMMNIPDRKNR